MFDDILLFLDLPSFKTTPSRPGIVVLAKTVLIMYSTGICRLSAQGCVLQNPTFPYFPSILVDPARHDGAVPYYDGVITRILTCASVDSRLWAVFPLSR